MDERKYDMTNPIIVTGEMLSEAPEDAIIQFVTKAFETQDAFIFETIRPFCEDQTNMTITKDELIRALTLLREKEPVGGWISVQDRLPEERGRYLCWFGKNTFCVGADIATYLPEWHGFGVLESDTVLQNITHWMPLPEPPEEVSVDDA